MTVRLLPLTSHPGLTRSAYARFGVLDASTVAQYRAPVFPKAMGIVDERTQKANDFVLNAERPCCVKAALAGLEKLRFPLLPHVFEALEKSPIVLDAEVTLMALRGRDGWPEA